MGIKLVVSFAFMLCLPIMAFDTTLTATRLFTVISAEREKDAQMNFVFSPLSILGVFKMAQLGAGGETKKEMDALVSADEDFKLPSFTFWPNDAEEVVKVETANRIYTHKSLEANKYFKTFNEKLRVAAGSDARTIDFAQGGAAAKVMNKFVEERTHGHIKDLIDPSTLSEATRLVLLNALYFKASWMSQFRTEDTREGVFYGETVDGPMEQHVKFMHQRMDDGGVAYFQDSDVTALSMSYADRRLQMYVFMPANMKAFESEIAAEPEALEKLAMRVKSSGSLGAEVILDFPKFKLDAQSNSLDLVDLFRRLGARRMFDPAEADFSGMTGDRQLSVSSFVHQADIEVDEQGTEATAGTGMGMMLLSMGRPGSTVHLVIDKPFIFQVRLEREAQRPLVLFTGRISDAKAAQ